MNTHKNRRQLRLFSEFYVYLCNVFPALAKPFRQGGQLRFLPYKTPFLNQNQNNIEMKCAHTVPENV